MEIARECGTGPAADVGTEVAELALIVTTAIYSPDEPTRAAAQRAWELEDQVRTRMRHGVPLQRVLRHGAFPLIALGRSRVQMPPPEMA